VVETIKRQIRAAYGWLVVGRSLWAKAGDPRGSANGRRYRYKNTEIDVLTTEPRQAEPETGIQHSLNPCVLMPPKRGGKNMQNGYGHRNRS